MDWLLVRYYVTIRGRTAEVDLTHATPAVDGVPMPVELLAVPGPGLRHLLVDGESVPMHVTPGDHRGRWNLSMGAHRIPVEVVDERTRAIRAMGGGGAVSDQRTVTAPMPGLVVKVEVEPGQTVRAGQGVVVVEAMKMENELKAPADGIVAEVAVRAGQTVEKGALLIALNPIPDVDRLE